jgi:hypothetical protein
MKLKNQCMRVNLCYLSCDCCSHYLATIDIYVVLQSCGMRETCHLRFLLHDLRHVLCLRVDILASSDIQIHSAQNYYSNSIVCLICHLIFSLYLFEAGSYDSGSVVSDLENSDSSSIVCDLHLSDGYLDFSLLLDDLCLFLYLSL